MFGPIQREFALALLDAGKQPPPPVTSYNCRTPVRRLNVYRNNVIVSLVDALRTKFPVVEKIVGAEFFGAMARQFVIENPPRAPVLMFYGDDLADYIEDFAPAAQVPYLADVARLEAMRTHAYHAADAVPVDPSKLSRSDTSLLVGARVFLHPSMRIVCSKYPVVTIWRMNNGEVELGEIAIDSPEDAAVIRPQHDVAVHRLTPGNAAFVTSLAGGATIAVAAERAGLECAEFDLAIGFAELLSIGALTGVLIPTARKDG
jgi:hypothetical protein